MINKFIIDGVSSYEDMGIIITSSNSNSASDNDIEFISVPGRNGDVLMPKKRFNNFELTYECLIKGNISEQKSKLNRIKNWLNSFSTYVKLRDTYNDDGYRYVCYNSKFAPSIGKSTSKFTITFNAKPFINMFSGEMIYRTYDDNSARVITLTNPTRYDAKPIIEIIGTADATITIGDNTITFTNDSENNYDIFIDCETENAYSTTQNINSAVSGLNNIVLPGNSTTTITLSSTNANIYVSPKWVRL